MSTSEIIGKLSTGGNEDYWLKIIGGQRREEIEPLFESEYEGYLYPDSYLIPKDYSNTQILDIILNNFEKQYTLATVDSTVTQSEENILILASLLEREARQLKSKQMVAGILYNRLKINMSLQLDATVQYARDTLRRPSKYWQPLQKGDIANIKSKYNTYLEPGLPPGPICNPGYDSIYAATHPIDSDYLYYITGNDNEMHYAKTLDEHNQNIVKYLR